MLETFIAGLTPIELGVGGVLVLAGLFGGWLLSRGRRPDRARFAELEAKLEASESALESQRAGVDKHFAQTSELFGDLTRQYTTLYAHLAEGARELVSEEARTALARGFEAGPALAAELAAEEVIEQAAESASEPGNEPSQAAESLSSTSDELGAAVESAASDLDGTLRDAAAEGTQSR